MRIKGGKDYYDGGLAQGLDEDLVFVRARHSAAEIVGADLVGLRAPAERIGLKDVDLKVARKYSNGLGGHYDNEVRRHDCRYRFGTMCVWFAGKRYGGIRVVQSFYGSGKEDVVRLFWEEGKFREFLSSIEVRPRKPSYLGSEHYLDDKGLAEHFSGRGAEAEELWAIENGAAIAIWIDEYGQKGWKLNTDGLKELDFVRVIDTYAAFQELSMFVGGVMSRPGAPMVEITDDRVKAAKHGFDNWSFRKMPQG